MFYSIPTLATMFTIASCSKEKSENEVSEIRKSTPKDFYCPFCVSIIVSVAFCFLSFNAVAFLLAEFFCYAACLVASEKKFYSVLTALIPLISFIPVILNLWNVMNAPVVEEFGVCVEEVYGVEPLGIFVCSLLTLISCVLPFLGWSTKE